MPQGHSFASQVALTYGLRASAENSLETNTQDAGVDSMTIFSQMTGGKRGMSRVAGSCERWPSPTAGAEVGSAIASPGGRDLCRSCLINTYERAGSCNCVHAN